MNHLKQVFIIQLHINLIGVTIEWTGWRWEFHISITDQEVE
jgi:hypothetical protein